MSQTARLTEETKDFDHDYNPIDCFHSQRAAQLDSNKKYYSNNLNTFFRH